MNHFIRVLSLMIGAVAMSGFLSAKDKFAVTVSNDLSIARPSETIAISMKTVFEHLPDTEIDCLLVRDSEGKIIPSQVTRVTPDGTPVFDELLWQHSFKFGEKKATFTIEKKETAVPPFPSKTFGRYVPERLDDFAWENDRIAFRMYGPRLDSPEAQNNRMVSSGVDVWLKSVDYPIIDRWYLKGDYHADNGEGLDMYDVGTNRGCGGTGIWDGRKIYTSLNYKEWRVLSNGPIRTSFELSYDSWDANGVFVREKKRISIDAGQNLYKVAANYYFSEKELLKVAIGLSKPPRNATYEISSDKTGWLANWSVYSSNGSIGIAAVLPSDEEFDFAEDNGNNYIITNVRNGVALNYYTGAVWNKNPQAGIKNKDDWNKYLSDFALRLKHPLKISVSNLKE